VITQKRELAYLAIMRDLNNRQLYVRLLGYLKPYLAVFALSLVGMALTAGSEVALPVLVKPFLDGTFVEKNPHVILWTPVALVLIFAVRGGGGFLAQFGSAWVGNKVVLDLRQEMHSKILELPLSYIQTNQSGGIISRFSFDVNQVQYAVTQVVTVLVKDFLTLFGLFGYLLYLDWQLTTITLIMAPPIAVVVRYFNKRMRQSSLATQESMGELTNRVRETVDCAKVIRIYQGVDAESARFFKTTNKLRGVIMKQVSAAAANVPVVQFFAALATGVVIYYVTLRVQSEGSTVGGFVSFLAAMLMMTAPIKRLAGVTEHLQRGLAAAESIFELLDRPGEEDGGRSVEKLNGKIEFKNVNFAYSANEELVLKNINLSIAPGEKIAIVGASGSGKTTLVGLLPRFYDISAGELLVDDHEVRTLSLKSLRKNIALVSQETSLFYDTILANITYGCNQNASEDKILAAAEAAHVLEFAQKMPNGLRASVGEDGSNLSGGQRQRVAIARAILKDAQVVILDEATSALDSESEKYIQEALEVLTRGKTTIIIAHRFTTIEKADRIVVLDGGRIVEQGNHPDLLSARGVYANLYALQSSGVSAPL
jgi:subfamily B ATP-binding cassette protein MsbA